MRGLIVIPAYNEEQNLAGVVERLRAASPAEDLLVVNDGSRDGTEEELRRLGIDHVRHPINLGYVRALQTGIRYALGRGYDYVVLMDADGQHDPAHVGRLTRKMEETGADIVIGSRFVDGGSYKAPLGRRLGMLVFSWLTGLFGKRRIHDTTSGFKCLRRRALVALRDQAFADFHAETIIFCSLIGLEVVETQIEVAERKHGVSMYGPFDALIYPLKTCVAILVLMLVRSGMPKVEP